ncbi:MaoC/PaaZ C-terminal domain-containing protein [Demequina flava]|uniref:MaoC/PaaZ C-terminal domain-containing protein n=1 Tax=Demequina flava TaxID=1095025 RepID=UPI00128D3AFA|nr:MaoC/PaaZ C-terminal domain-containing protein [Demequina flava]
MPSMGGAAARSLVPSRDKRARVPSSTFEVRDLVQETARLADYARVCGFTLRDTVPATWLHVLAFPLHIQALGSQDSTIRLMGAVHVANRMTMLRPVSVSERLTIGVRADNVRPHRRGALVDLVADIRSGDETVWDGVSTYLASGMTAPGDAPDGSHEPFEAVTPHARWRVPARTAKDYRRVSGDPNPIHTNRLAAKAFGFPRPIVHGMWTHARALAALEGSLGSSYSVGVDFVKPVLLPGTIGFSSSHEDGVTTADVTTKDGTKPHLRMRVEAVS